MTLEEIIRKRLEEATAAQEIKTVAEEVKTEELAVAPVEEAKKEVELKGDSDSEESVDLDPKMKKVAKKEVVKEETTAEEVVDEALRLAGSSDYQGMARYPKGHSAEGDAHRDKTAKMAKDIRRQGREIGGGSTKVDSDNSSASAPRVRKYDSAQVQKESTEDQPTSGSVSAQVSALLEAEGLSEEFKTQAVTIFEAAVTDRVLQIQEELKTQFDAQLAEAKEQLNNDIDGVLSEAVEKWHKENEVAIESNFKSQRNESFMDGLFKLIAEHSIDISEDQEDALEVALSEVEKLQEGAKEHESTVATLQEEINQLKSKSILESFSKKMTQIEFDRFKQLVENVRFETEEQYDKQLNIVLENFGNSKQTEAKSETQTVVIAESVIPTQVEVKTVDSQVSSYAQFILGKKK